MAAWLTITHGPVPMVVLLAQFTGALLGTWVVTRVTLFLTRRLGSWPGRIPVSHSLALALSTIVGGYGYGTLEDPRFSSAFATYVIPVIIWAFVDTVRHRRHYEHVETDARNAQHMEPKRLTDTGADSPRRLM